MPGLHGPERDFGRGGELFGLGWSRRDWQSLAEVLRRAGFSESMGVEAALLGKSERGRAYDRFRGRLMFPIRSLSGNVIAFGGRIIANEDEAKYINSSDSQLYEKKANTCTDCNRPGAPLRRESPPC